MNSNKKGSAEIEAAIVFPLVVLIVMGMLQLSIDMVQENRSSSHESLAETRERLEQKLVCEENILRTGWVFR